jgi:hypothetical protein
MLKVGGVTVSVPKKETGVCFFRNTNRRTITPPHHHNKHRPLTKPLKDKIIFSPKGDMVRKKNTTEIWGVLHRFSDFELKKTIWEICYSKKVFLQWFCPLSILFLYYSVGFASKSTSSSRGSYANSKGKCIGTGKGAQHCPSTGSQHDFRAGQLRGIFPRGLLCYKRCILNETKRKKTGRESTAIQALPATMYFV